MSSFDRSRRLQDAPRVRQRSTSAVHFCTRETVTDGGLIKRVPVVGYDAASIYSAPAWECAVRDTPSTQNENLPH
ncbi:hypothetical protein CNECB9_1740043 [Cupriavidus necator]|uniref:Uncharacterized protein n=1 Tax=Cupriavidus necator TaxID=106590 RepID=A0A1K0J919_CUPNE|nr:hypothetical protein CNECB9_1740043 [Cupriavidus necator]